MSETIEFVRPFSNGEESRSWTALNCDRCVRNGYQRAGEDECPLEVALSMGTITGTIHVDVAVAIGATIPDDDPECCDMPAQCECFKDRDDRGDDDAPSSPPIDPTQLTFLPPDGWPAERVPRRKGSLVG